MGSTVDGLVSGLNTTQLIQQLMQVEAQPQTAIKNKVSAEQKMISGYQSVNTKLSALQTAADTLTQDKTWQATKAASSSTSVTATASAGAPAGEYAFHVSQLAKAQIATTTAGPGGAMVSGNSLDLVMSDGIVSIDIPPASNTAEGVVAAVNAANAGVRAALVHTDSGDIVQFQAAKTGVVGGFSLIGLVNDADDAVPAQDAQVTFGSGAGSYTVSSSSNTFTNVIPNTSFTVSKEEDVNISVTADAGGLADKVQAMVDAANAALTEMAGQTAYNSATKSGGPLSGNFAIRQIQQNVLSSVSNGSADYGSFAQFGVSLDAGGKLKFDRNAFTTAFQADPTKTQAAIGTGLSQSLDDLAKGATDKTTGTITLAVQGGNDMVKRYNTEIDNWDVRLADRQQMLERQFTSLETALGTMKNQSNWLSGQIAGMLS
jgi:flagellar hook-associated protein 2